MVAWEVSRKGLGPLQLSSAVPCPLHPLPYHGNASLGLDSRDRDRPGWPGGEHTRERDARTGDDLPRVCKESSQAIPLLISPCSDPQVSSEGAWSNFIHCACGLNCQHNVGTHGSFQLGQGCACNECTAALRGADKDNSVPSLPKEKDASEFHKEFFALLSEDSTEWEGLEKIT